MKNQGALVLGVLLIAVGVACAVSYQNKQKTQNK